VRHEDLNAVVEVTICPTRDAASIAWTSSTQFFYWNPQIALKYKPTTFQWFPVSDCNANLKSKPTDFPVIVLDFSIEPSRQNLTKYSDNNREKTIQ
jgi:hypothetical protein